MISQGRIKISVMLFMLLNVVALNAVIQTELRNGEWQLIGFMGPLAGAEGSVGYRQDINREVIDIADENTTYLVKENDNAAGQLAYKTGINDTDLLTTYTGTTTQIGSSIGIFAIKNQQSPSGETTLASTLATAVKMKIANPKQFIPNIPKYRMYLEGNRGVPAVRIDYQADYQGQSFKIKFGNENIDYVGYFNYENTFLTPAKLVNSADIVSDVNSYSTPIQDSIDFNINDNNITKMLLNNVYTVKDTSGVYNQDLTDYSSSVDYQATVYKFEGGVWKHFDSRNAKESSNDFINFDTGIGYWIKIDNALTTREIRNEALTPTKTGLISSSTATIDPTTYNNTNNDWNLLSFRDTDIRYAPSGVFIPQNVWNTEPGGVRIFFKSEGRTNGVLSGGISLGSTTENTYSDTNSAARAINLAMQVKNDIASEFQKVRAIPAMDFNSSNDSIPGIIIISDGLFELNTSGSTTANAPENERIRTLAKGDLKQLANGNYGSVYGEYMNFININTALDAFPEVNASLSLYIHNGNSAAQKTNALNDINNSSRLRNVLSAFENAATKNGETVPYTRTSGYLTAINFDAETDYSKEGNMTSMLLVSGERYSISDSTFTKVYKYKDGGKFSIISSKGSRGVDATASTTTAGVVTTINTQIANTGVTAVDLGVATGTTDQYFAIISTEKGLELLENDSSNLFEDISLTNGAIPNIDRTKGPITSVHSANNLFDTSIVINRDIIDGNVSYFGVFDTNYTRFYDDNKTFEDNGSAVITSAMTTVAGSLWTGQTIYFTNTNASLPSGTYLIGGDLIIEDSNISMGGTGGTDDVTLRVAGRIITKGAVVLELKDTTTITTGFFNDRDSNATSFSQINHSNGALTFGAIDNSIAIAPLFVESNLTNTDINGTTIRYADINVTKADLDKNVSNIMVGLFNLNGADFPSVSNDLGSASHWVLDFPLQGGLIEDLRTNYNKSIDSILTMDYSTAAQGSGESYWRNTDLTKNIDTLYGNSFNTDNDLDFNNDYQGIFRIQPNKAYWINLSDKPASTQTIDSIVKPISGVTYQAKAHFANTFNDDFESTTQNHINHQLNIQFNDTFKGKNSNYYNVVAIIAGKRYYLKRNGSIFNLGIDDNEMALKAGLPTNKEIPIILEVYDGQGTKIIEQGTTSKYKILFYKPQTPKIQWNTAGKLEQTNLNANDTLELYTSFVSDIESERNKKRLTSNDLSESNITSLKWNADGNISLKGAITSIRAVTKSTDGFYSDMKAILYAPIDKGHVLEASANLPKAIIPFSFLQNQYLTKRENNGSTIDYPAFVTNADGTTNGRNGGVQLNIITAAARGNNIKIAYYPDGETEGAKSLTGTGFSGSRVMYLRVNDGPTTTDAIASISYLPGYEDKIFYITFNNKLYQGRFAGVDTYSNDNTPYNLAGGELTPTAFINNASAQAMIGGSSGLEIKTGTEMSQIIYIPKPKPVDNNNPVDDANTPNADVPVVGNQLP